MPKMKTRRAAAKRFKLTGTKKIVHNVAGGSHLLAHESMNLKRGRRGNVVLHKTQLVKVKRMLGV
jgi:large subunit ribosomal protein L35